MSSLIGSLFSGTTGESADKMVAYNAAYGAAATSQAYFTAALAATTPELRAFLSGYCTQSLTGHESMMNYMIQKNWINPYEDPNSQLSRVVQESTQPSNLQ
jgi:spore coat protein CotF